MMRMVIRRHRAHYDVKCCNEATKSSILHPSSLCLAFENYIDYHISGMILIMLIICPKQFKEIMRNFVKWKWIIELFSLFRSSLTTPTNILLMDTRWLPINRRDNLISGGCGGAGS